jgi:hypothetical protein
MGKSLLKSSLKKDTNPTETVVNNLIEKMLILAPEKRLSIAEVHKELKRIYNPGTLLKTDPEKPPDSDTSSPPKLIISKNFKH